MCSWCWGSRPTFQKLLDQLADHASTKHIKVQYLLGGLAADSNQPMPADLRPTIRSTWQQIQKNIPGTTFNYDFWTDCSPRRSTYPACRAVIAASLQNTESAYEMTHAIQQAYYLQAKDPSDAAVLIELAADLGLDTTRFKNDLNSTSSQQQLNAEIAQCRALYANGFPSLILQHQQKCIMINIDYNHTESMLRQIIDAIRV